MQVTWRVPIISFVGIYAWKIARSINEKACANTADPVHFVLVCEPCGCFDVVVIK